MNAHNWTSSFLLGVCCNQSFIETRAWIKYFKVLFPLSFPLLSAPFSLHSLLPLYSTSFAPLLGVPTLRVSSAGPLPLAAIDKSPLPSPRAVGGWRPRGDCWVSIGDLVSMIIDMNVLFSAILSHLRLVRPSLKFAPLDNSGDASRTNPWPRRHLVPTQVQYQAFGLRSSPQRQVVSYIIVVRLCFFPFLSGVERACNSKKSPFMTEKGGLSLVIGSPVSRV